MSDIIKTTLREPEGPEHNKPERIEQIVEEFKELGKTGKKYINAKAAQESAKAQEIVANILTQAGELELKRHESLRQREKQQKELELLEKRDKNAHIERMMELQIQEQKNKIDTFNAVTERLKIMKELGIPLNIKETKLDNTKRRLLDSK